MSVANQESKCQAVVIKDVIQAKGWLMVSVQSEALVNIAIFSLKFFVDQKNELFVSNFNHKVQEVQCFQENQRIEHLDPNTNYKEIL